MTLLCRLLTATVRKLTQTKYTHKNTYSQLHVKKPKLWPWNFLIDLYNLQEKNISIMHICYKVCFPSKQMCIHISKQIKMKGKKEEMTLSVKSHENLHTFNQTCLRIINKVWGFYTLLDKKFMFLCLGNKSYYSTYRKYVIEITKFLFVHATCFASNKTKGSQGTLLPWDIYG